MIDMKYLLKKAETSSSLQPLIIIFYFLQGVMQKYVSLVRGERVSEKLSFCSDKWTIRHSVRGRGGMKFRFFRVKYFLQGPQADHHRLIYCRIKISPANNILLLSKYWTCTRTTYRTILLNILSGLSSSDSVSNDVDPLVCHTSVSTAMSTITFSNLSP